MDVWLCQRLWPDSSLSVADGRPLNLPDRAFVQTFVEEVDISQAAACEKAVFVAKAFVASACLAVWIRRQNFEHGVAPSAQATFHQYQKLAGPQAPRLVHRRSIHAWVMRWRKRWRFKRAKLPLREDLDASSITLKVGAGALSVCGFLKA